jgi:hypothetical protein
VKKCCLDERGASSEGAVKVAKASSLETLACGKYSATPPFLRGTVEPRSADLPAADPFERQFFSHGGSRAPCVFVAWTLA